MQQQVVTVPLPNIETYMVAPMHAIDYRVVLNFRGSKFLQTAIFEEIVSWCVANKPGLSLSNTHSHTIIRLLEFTAVSTAMLTLKVSLWRTFLVESAA